MPTASRAPRAARRPAESVAWALAQLGGEHFAVGQLDRAEARYLEALKTYPNYYRGLAGLLPVLLVVFFLAGDRVRWEILLVGLAWRIWFLIYTLPAWLALWNQDERSND